jgi:hypothetical protein
MSPNDLTHTEKDELISLTKIALELACAKLACYEGHDSPHASMEHWVGVAYLSTKVKGWKNGKGT